MKKVTIKDVARESGVSIATVSLILNNKPSRISKETKERVRRVSKELNYRADQRAVSMITGRTYTLGLIVPDISNPFFAELAKGAEEQANALEYNVFLCNSNDATKKDIEYLEILLDRGVDGILLAGSSDLSQTSIQKTLREVQRNGKALVLLDRLAEDMEITNVGVDHKTGAYLATTHLIDNGHTRIGCINGPLEFYSARQRYKGYQDALKETGLPLETDLVIQGEYHIESGYRSVDSLLLQKATGVFATNDMMAVGVYKRCHELGVAVPETLSVIGFDDLYFAQLLEVPLTTIQQPAYDIGQRAVQSAVAQIEAPDTPVEDIVFPPTLIQRSSVKKIG